MGEVLSIIAAIALILFNIIGIIWLGIKLDHPFLVTIAYIVVLVVIGNINGDVCLIVVLAVAVISLLACIIGIVLLCKEVVFEAVFEAVFMIQDAIEEKRLEKEQKQRNVDLLDAVMNGDVESAKKLIEMGGDIEYCDSEKQEPMLQIAIKKSDKEMVSLLLDNGADENCVCNGKTPLDFATNEEIITLLKSKGAKTKAELEAEAEESRKKYQMQIMLNENLITAIQKNAIDIVESLIAQGADVNYSTMEGNSPLTFAISKGNMDILKLLLKNGADPNKKNHTLGGGEVSAVTYARYKVRDERLADFLEYY